jgi:hypothetical protein
VYFIISFCASTGIKHLQKHLQKGMQRWYKFKISANGTVVFKF